AAYIDVVGIGRRFDLVARRRAESGDDRVADERHLEHAVRRRDADVAGAEVAARIALGEARVLHVAAVDLDVVAATACGTKRRRRDERGDERKTKGIWHGPIYDSRIRLVSARGTGSRRAAST